MLTFNSQVQLKLKNLLLRTPESANHHVYFDILQRIPPEFLRLYLHELPDTVILKGPSGNEWPAKLCEAIDYVYIQDDGWRNFHRDNALGNSECLIFQYDGKNCFEVQVFDPTGVERLNVAGAKSMRINNPKHPVDSQNLPLLKSPNSQGNALSDLWQN